MFVLFATPCLTAEIKMDFLTSFLETSALLRGHGISHIIRFQAGIPFIDHARNVLCHTFLSEFPMATDLFFLDDDIGWNAQDVLRLLQYDVDMVGGVYPLKQDELGFPTAVMGQNGHLVERDGLISAFHLPGGFLRIRRNVIEQMATDQPKYPHRRADGITDQIANIFHTGYNEAEGERLGEDVDFCNRWREMGGELFLDPNIILSHNGRKRWTASYAEVVPLIRQKLEQVHLERSEAAQEPVEG